MNGFIALNPGEKLRLKITLLKPDGTSLVLSDATVVMARTPDEPDEPEEEEHHERRPNPQGS